MISRRIKSIIIMVIMIGVLFEVVEIGIIIGGIMVVIIKIVVVVVDILE